MEKAGLLDVAIAPLHWLERSRGWKRRGLLVLYGTIALTVGTLGWREASLWRLPNIREPFDEAKLGSVELAGADNAIPLYREAGARIRSASNEVYQLNLKQWNVTDWAAVNPRIRRWVEDNRAALETWLLAVDRPDALLVQPREMTISTPIGPIQSIGELSRLATLEGSRLERAGDLAGAWRFYRGLLRSSRHAGRHGGKTQRVIGNSILLRTRPLIVRWVDNPEVTSDLLRRAIGDVEAARAMTAPTSDMVIAEYFSRRDALDHPENWRKFDIEGPEEEAVWYNQISAFHRARHFLLREPERSHRVHRLITAGLLAQCDRPRALRPKLVSSRYDIYAVDSATPPAVASIPPEELASWADRSAYSAVSWSTETILASIDSERGLFDDLIIRMAGRAYQIDRGQPASTYGDLLGHYLKALPEGFAPDGPVDATP